MYRNLRIKQCLLPIYNGQMVRLYITNISDQNLYDVELKVISNAVELMHYRNVPYKYIKDPDGFTVFILDIPKKTSVYIEYSINAPCNMNKNILNYIQLLKTETNTPVLIDKIYTQDLTYETYTQALMGETNTQVLIDKIYTQDLTYETYTQALIGETNTQVLIDKIYTQDLTYETYTQALIGETNTQVLIDKIYTQDLTYETYIQALTDETDTQALIGETNTQALIGETNTQVLIDKIYTQDLTYATYMQTLTDETNTPVLIIRNSVVVQAKGKWSEISTVDVKIKI